MTGCRDIAADLAQETFLKAYENLEKFRLSESFFPWLYAIAANLARDRWRKERHAADHAEQVRQAMESCPEKLAAVEDHMTTLLDAHRLKQCMDQLPDDYREALMLRYHEGLPIRDIGTALGVSNSGAKMRIHRGLAKLKALFTAAPATCCNQASHNCEDN